MDKPENVESKLKMVGRRMTKVRRALSELFASIVSPVSVEGILRFLETEKGLTPHKTTVYRELEYFLDRGVIKAIDFGDGRRRYEMITDTHHHHVMCVACKKVGEVSLPDEACNRRNEVLDQTGFMVVRHSLEFFGLCSRCQLA